MHRRTVFITKPLRDLASILCDDLEFKAMSLPRAAAAILTARWTK